MYMLVFVPLLLLLAYLLKYRARLLKAKSLLELDSSLKMNNEENRFNPLFTRSYIEFIDGDEKGMTDQKVIMKQREEIDYLEVAFREARVGVDCWVEA